VVGATAQIREAWLLPVLEAMLRQFPFRQAMKSCRPLLFRKRKFEPTVIVTCVRWYLRFSLSLRDLEELMADAAYWLITRASGAGRKLMALKSTGGCAVR
jgi:hypothetical protein